MPAVVFFTHVPLVHLAEPELPFGGGELASLPWELYDELSQGAFTDFEKQYKANAPTFFRLDRNIDGPPVSARSTGQGMLEATVPSGAWDTALPPLGLRLLANYSLGLVDFLWTALVLTGSCPAPQPRLSVTFAVRGEEECGFEVQANLFDGIRVHGEAANEFLFSPRHTGFTVDRETVEWGERLIPVVHQAVDHPRLLAALTSLQSTTHPSLSPLDRTTLAVVALESLLLPNVFSGLGATFGRRLAALLAPESDRGPIEKLGRSLYDARSGALHGHSQTDGGADGEAVLAAAIRALAEAAGEDGDVAAICEGLDEGSRAGASAAANGWRSPYADPLARGPSPLVSGSGSHTMPTPEGKFLSWSPLVGLGSEKDWLEFGSGVFLISAAPARILSLEDKDIRRELASLAMSTAPAACLGFAAVAEDMVNLRRSSLRRQALRARDLTVVALRLAGLAAFVDPELLGAYFSHDALRLSQSTVFRQTILLGLGADPDEVIHEPEKKQALADWRLLYDYNSRAVHRDIERVLSLFRRAHDRLLLPPPAHEALLIAVLEATLGRFRKPDDPVQLEDLVLAITGMTDPYAHWFAENGRSFRNSVAHGTRHGDAEAAPALLNLLRLLTRALVTTWLEEGGGERRPRDVLVEHASAKLGA